MLKQIIIFGVGADGKEALHYFGASSVFCFVDNNTDMVGQYIEGKTIISFSELKHMFEENLLLCKISFEVIIAVSKSRWAMFSIANQILQVGIQDFSVYKDIKRRWKCGTDFVERDRAVYPCEQESVLEIYKYQLNYMIRHTDPTTMLPATGELRRNQLEIVEHANRFFGKMKALEIKPFMVSGTLIGAIRHAGFIPWDDDLDFALLYAEYQLLLAQCEKETKIFYHVGNDVWQTREGERSCSTIYPYIIACGFGYMQVYYNIGAAFVKGNLQVCDIFPIYYFGNQFSNDIYAAEYRKWVKKRNYDFERVDELYKKELLDTNMFPKQSIRVGYGCDLTSALAYWHYMDGKNFDNKIWDIKDLLPLRKHKFENHEFWAPCNPKHWLAQESNDDPMKLPSRVGVYVHDKERIFTDIY